jgi:hypothetical protein
VSYFFIFGRGENDKIISNALVGSAMGWIFSSGLVFLLNTAAVWHLWGRELEFGDKDTEDDSQEDDGAIVVLRGDSKKKRQEVSSGAGVENGGQSSFADANAINQQRTRSLGGGFGVGFRKNSGINTLMSNALAPVPTTASEGRDRATTGGSARSRATTGESQGMYARLLSGSKLQLDEDDSEDDLVNQLQIVNLSSYERLNYFELSFYNNV